MRTSHKLRLYQEVNSNAPSEVWQKPRVTAIQKVSSARPGAVSAVLPAQSWCPQSKNVRKRFLEDLPETEVPSLDSAVALVCDPLLHRMTLWKIVTIRPLVTKPQPNISEYGIWFLDQCDA